MVIQFVVYRLKLTIYKKKHRNNCEFYHRPFFQNLIFLIPWFYQKLSKKMTVESESMTHEGSLII